MAKREHIKCPSCGSQRQRDAFGIRSDGGYDPEKAIGYPASLSIQTIGGRGRCTWEKNPLPGFLAEGLRRRLYDVLQDLEQEMRDGGMQLEDLD